MIKRYILHIEAHKRHLPRISFKRAPRPGDRVVDGGVPGTLRLCPECQDGLLHEPDPVRRRASRTLPPGPHKWRGSYCVHCKNSALFCPYPPRSHSPRFLGFVAAELIKNIETARSHPVRPARPYRPARPEARWTPPTHVELKETDTEPETTKLIVTPPAEHVELQSTDEVEHVELTSEEDSPETLELEYKDGTTKRKRGDILWTHKAEYVVDKFKDNTLYLVRKDVWDARKKKAKVEETKTETPSTHVELNFD